MDIVENLRAHAPDCELNGAAALEIEHLRAANEILRAENEILRTALECADIAMAGAPIWHGQHLVLSEILADLKKTLAAMEPAAEA
ncbi:hypothetical protein [Zoogloea dura]|jgi:hypothetical protein|uniref:Uncharacterized protein n=1 Tax=Zoogloea dura TaxID=2728840 RepID=A0A848G5K3_9RHOO|nr:hypothetical protein [Zoogloea dura]NML26216.1 hypothetical protein [Zoogloea dura]